MSQLFRLLWELNSVVRSVALSILLFACLSAIAVQPATASEVPTPAKSRPSAFLVHPHDNAPLEWWYLNAHLQTSSGHRFAVIGSFFRFGSGAEDNHTYYLLYAVTDIDSKKHFSYSLGDRKTLDLMQQEATLELENSPKSAIAKPLMTVLSHAAFPPPTKTIPGDCRVSYAPFVAEYGSLSHLRAVPGTPNTYALRLNAGPGTAKMTLRFSGVRAPMLVNGDGNTGLQVHTDMKYISLTRCTVVGEVDTGSGPEPVTGQGWFDHQWGSSWTGNSVGWDWWGTQLADGTDILFFQQLNLKTGVPFFPCATFEDASGRQETTHHIEFHADPNSIWTSPTTKIAYPLHWTITFPDQDVSLDVSSDVDDQEMPALVSGGAIWEGTCTVAATVAAKSVPGVAYMELVGYNSPAVRASISAQAGHK
jgi:predicted secreted hydrolase